MFPDVFQMNTSADRDSPSPNALGDLRSFRFCKKPSFSHDSGSSAGTADESPGSIHIQRKKKIIFPRYHIN